MQPQHQHCSPGVEKYRCLECLTSLLGREKGSRSSGRLRQEAASPLLLLYWAFGSGNPSMSEPSVKLVVMRHGRIEMPNMTSTFWTWIRRGALRWRLVRKDGVGVP